MWWTLVISKDTLTPSCTTAYALILCGQWQEISEEHFNDQLNVLSPVFWYDGGFFMSERYTFDVSAFYQRWHGRFYTSYQRLGYDRDAILDSLARYMVETQGELREQETTTEVT